MMNNHQNHKLSQESHDEANRQERLLNQGFRLQQQQFHDQHPQANIMHQQLNPHGYQQNIIPQQYDQNLRSETLQAQYGHQFEEQKLIDGNRVDQIPMSQQVDQQQYTFQSIFNQPSYYNYDSYQHQFQKQEGQLHEENYSHQNQRQYGSANIRQIMPNAYFQQQQERSMYQTPQKEQTSIQQNQFQGYSQDSNQLIPQELFNQKFPQTTTLAGSRKFSEEHNQYTGQQKFAQDTQQQPSHYGQKVLYEKGYHETESLNKFCEIQNPSENSSIQNQQHNYLIDFVLNEGDEEKDIQISEKLSEKQNNYTAESYQEESLATNNLNSYLPLQMNPRGANSLDRIGQTHQYESTTDNKLDKNILSPATDDRNNSYNLPPYQNQVQQAQLNYQQQPRFVLQQNQVMFKQQPAQEDINQLQHIDYQNDINQLQQTKRYIQNKIEHLQRAQNQNYDHRIYDQSNYLRDESNEFIAERQQNKNYNAYNFYEQSTQDFFNKDKIVAQKGIKADHKYGNQQMLNLDPLQGGKINDAIDKNRKQPNQQNLNKRRSNQKKASSEKNSPYTSTTRKLQQQKHGNNYQKSSPSEDYEDIEIDLKLELKPQVASNAGKLSGQIPTQKKKHSEIYSTSNILKGELGPLSDVGDIFEDNNSPPKSQVSKNSGDKKYQAKNSKGNKTHSDSKNKSRTDASNPGPASLKSKNSSDSHANLAFDKFMQQIQTDIKQANEDPEKEFQVLDGHIIFLATKKIGSKFLQDHLKKAKQSLINKIQQQIEDHLPELMMDNYGNYFCSQLIENLQVHQRIRFLKQIKGDKFIEISCNNRGTYALQNIIQLVTQDEEFDLVRETLEQNNNICKLAKDIQGQHMIQKIIKSFNEERREYIFDRICSQFKELATDKQGLCVMKVLIQNTEKPENRKVIIDRIIEDGLEYVQNEYGNFVVSEALTYYKFEHTKRIYEQMRSHFAKLSQNKFASKFIEICIDKAPKDTQFDICKEFCHSPYLNKVIQSKFGNFVLQKSIKTFKDPELIECTINSLGDVTQFQVQQKWGSDLLVKFINDLPAKDKDRLTKILDEKMKEINDKYKEFKQHQSSEYHNSNNYYGYSSKAQVSSFSGGNKSSYGSHTGSYYNNYLNDQSSASGKGKTNSDHSYKNEDSYYASNQQSQRKVINMQQQSQQQKKPVKVVQKNNIKFANQLQSKKSGSGSEKEKDINQ